MENIIECNNLTHYYGKRLIYENLSFSVPKGRILGLLGKNGTGKTTTINILSGYLKPRSGQCSIFGQDIQTMHPSTRRNIGLLIEGHVQYQFMTIREIEKFYSAFYPGQWRKEAYYDLMDKLKVAPGPTHLAYVVRTTFASGTGTYPGAKPGIAGTGRFLSRPGPRAIAASSWTICVTMPARKTKLFS